MNCGNIPHIFDEASEKDVAGIFSAVRPVCVSLAKTPSCGLIQKLQEHLSSCKSEVLQHLCEYLLFPLRITISGQNGGNELCREAALSCTLTLLSKTSIDSWPQFLDLVTTLCMPLDENYSKLHSIKLSEEAQLDAIKILRCIFLNCQVKDIMSHLCNPKTLPILGHMISVVLALAEKAYRTITLESIQLLIVLISMPKDVSFSWGIIMASFLPGCVTSLSKIATHNPKPSQKIVTSTLECFWRLLVLTIPNNLVDGEPGSIAASKSSEVGDKLLVDRNKVWIESTAKRLLVLVKALSASSSSSEWRVRRSAYTWSYQLLMHCDQTLPGCVTTWLEILVRGLNDSHKQLQVLCEKHLQDYKRRVCDVGKDLSVLLEEGLLTLVTSLPRHSRSTNEATLREQLALLAGYLRILDSHVRLVLHSSCHTHRLLLALLEISEIDHSQAQLQGVVIDDDVTEDAARIRPKIYFCHFVEQQVQNNLVEVCRLLGQNGEFALILDQLMDIYYQSPSTRYHVFFLMNNVLIGARKQAQLNDVVVGFVNDILAQDALKHAFTRHIACSDDAKRDVVVTSLLLEGLANSARVLAEDFQPLLMDVLYVLLELLGAPDAAVVTNAHISLGDIATACGYCSTVEMLEKNSDYIINSLSLRLRHFSDNPGVLVVFIEMLRHCKEPMLKQMVDVVEALVDILDVYSLNQKQIVTALRELVNIIRMWNYSEPEPCVNELVQQRFLKAEDVANDLATFCSTMDEAEKLLQNDSVKVDDELELNEDLDEVENPTSAIERNEKIELIKTILTRCTHLISSNDVAIKTLALDTAITCCEILHHREDDLLPLVHQIWPALCQRFIHPEPVVTLRSFRLLGTLARVSRDFIRQRLLRDVIQPVCDFLRNHVSISASAGPVYCYSATCKWQQVVLEELKPVVSYTKLTSKTLCLLLSAILPYTAEDQPEILRNCGCELVEQFRLMDSDLVWLFTSKIL